MIIRTRWQFRIHYFRPLVGASFFLPQFFACRKNFFHIRHQTHSCVYKWISRYVLSYIIPSDEELTYITNASDIATEQIPLCSDYPVASNKPNTGINFTNAATYSQFRHIQLISTASSVGQLKNK